jgi:hypothetical protein
MRTANTPPLASIDVTSCAKRTIQVWEDTLLC